MTGLQGSVARPVWARLRGPAESSRIVGIDIARGLAVLGMFGAHIGVSEPFDWTPNTWLDLVNGRSSILFAVLAGVSIAIISGGRKPVSGVPLLQARARIFARAALIFVLGGLLTALGTQVAVILPAYAVLFVFALPFLRWSPQRLFALAGVLAIVMPVVYTAILPFFEALQPSAIVELVVTGHYPAMIWLVFVLVGLGVGRLDLRVRRVQGWMLGLGVALALLGYGIGSLVAPLGTSDPGRRPATLPSPLDFSTLLTTEAHSGSPFEVIGSTGFVLAVFALCLLAVPLLRYVLYPVAAVGAMALTAYSVHIVAIAFYGDIVGTIFDNSLYLSYVITALVGCTLWSLLFGRGPFERILTRVSHLAARITPAAAGRIDGDPISKENTHT
jgi:uncharacterized protein